MDEGLRDAVRATVSRPGMLRVHFQPIVDLARGVVTGYEALSRFNGPPSLPPDRWFAAAHEAGLGEQLEAYALAAALEARAWLPPNTFLTVNLGPRALLSDGVHAVLDRAGDLRGVVLEITEQQPIDDYGAIHEVLTPLRDTGVMVAVDDAGAGFSSLKHITTLRPDFVKVDSGLVSGIDQDPTKAAVIETLGIFASRLDAWLVAEGVETAGELDLLLGSGVPLGQGYFLARPSLAMGGISDEATTVCRRRAARTGSGELSALAEIATTVREGEGGAEVFLSRPGLGFAVMVDEFDRPVALLSRDRRRLPVLSVTPGDRLTDVARRVITRPAAERFAPLALCDHRGRLCGLIPVERLLGRLADAVDDAASPAAA